MNDIIDVLKKNENDVCVTLVLSGKLKSFDDKEKTQVRFRKAIATAKKLINAEHGEEAADSIVKQMNAQLSNLDFGKAREALAVYVTEGFGKSVWLPFREKERLTIRNSFDLQPLSDAMNRERDYWVLALSKNKTRLFRGKNEYLNEVIDDKFPVAYEEQFQYEKPRFAASYKPGTYSPRDPKTDIERIRAFFRHVDHLLKSYLKKEDLPIILLGVDSNLSDFSKTTSFQNNIVAKVKGNYDYQSAGEIARKVWKLAKAAVLPQVAME
jgi:hypothetical protein